MSSVAATTFHRFSDLPAAIQLIIWGHALTPGQETSVPLDHRFLIETANLRHGDPLIRPYKALFWVAR